MSRYAENKGVSLFVVDDSDSYRTLLNIMLQKEGYEVSSFDNGFDALNALSLFRPNLIVSDIEMPEMDGLDFYTEIEKRGFFEEPIPFVFISSTGFKSKIDKAEKLSSRELISKSLHPESIVKIIEGVLREYEKEGIE